jgi:PhnB protein
MISLNSYLIFNGECRKAFEFYKTIFKAEYEHIATFEEMRQEDDEPINEADKDKIMHVVLPIKDNFVLMGSDTNVNSGNVKVGDNISLSINCETKEEATYFYNELSKNGEQTMFIADTFWGAYFGMLTDAFGINWMINFDY